MAILPVAGSAAGVAGRSSPISRSSCSGCPGNSSDTMTPFIRLHPAGRRPDRPHPTCGRHAGRERHRQGPDPARPQGRHARHRRRASRCAATTRSSVLPAGRLPPASTCTRTTSGWATTGRLRARLRVRRRREARRAARREATFMGIRRADGRVATRNYIGILSSVNCSATAARAIADHFSRQTHPAALADFPNVDGVVALTHGTGCGMATEGLGMQILRAHAGRLCHACQFLGRAGGGPGLRGQPDQRLAGAQQPARGRDAQGVQHPGHRRHPQDGREGHRAGEGTCCRRPMPSRREPCSAAHITIGLQCGGSDGYSGISANPALGAAVDLLVAHGGTAILSRNARNLWRRAPADAPRGAARSRREADRAHPAGGSTTPRSTTAR